MTTTTVLRVIAATDQYLVARSPGVTIEPVNAATAICQDALIFGVDVDDYVNVLETEFGSVIRKIPWLTYTDQTSSFRGCMGTLAFPFWIVARFTRRATVGGSLIPKSNPVGHPLRLTLGHIAAVIDCDEWFEP